MPLAYTIPEVLKAVGIGRTKLYEAINSGELKAHKAGKRTIIKAADLEAWVDALPLLSPSRARNND